MEIVLSIVAILISGLSLFCSWRTGLKQRELNSTSLRTNLLTKIVAIKIILEENRRNSDNCILKQKKFEKQLGQYKGLENYNEFEKFHKMAKKSLRDTIDVKHNVERAIESIEQSYNMLMNHSEIDAISLEKIRHNVEASMLQVNDTKVKIGRLVESTDRDEKLLETFEKNIQCKL